MRYSVEPTDMGFEAYQDLRLKGLSLCIFLDGKQQNDVVTVDTREGWLIRYVKTGPTQYVVKGDCLVTERVEGKIDVVIASRSTTLN